MIIPLHNPAPPDPATVAEMRRLLWFTGIAALVVFALILAIFLFLAFTGGQVRIT